MPQLPDVPARAGDSIKERAEKGEGRDFIKSRPSPFFQ